MFFFKYISDKISLKYVSKNQIDDKLTSVNLFVLFEYLCYVIYD